MARAYAEFGENLPKVILNSSCADIEPRADFRVRQSIERQPGNLSLLRRQLVATGGDRALAGLLTSGLKLTPGPFGECLHSHRVEHAVRSAQLCPRFGAAALAPEPLPEEQMGA